MVVYDIAQWEESSDQLTSSDIPTHGEEESEEIPAEITFENGSQHTQSDSSPHSIQDGEIQPLSQVFHLPHLSLSLSNKLVFIWSLVFFAELF